MEDSAKSAFDELFKTEENNNCFECGIVMKSIDHFKVHLPTFGHPSIMEFFSA
jgi:hypothetical protein